jgi:tRNA modification GTPase
LADTAGLRDADDAIEAEGVRRALAWAQSAALRLFVVDASEVGDMPGLDAAGVLAAEDIVVLNKMDKAVAATAARCEAEARALGLTTVTASAALGAVDAVEGALRSRIVNSLAGAEAPTVTRLRHRETLGTAVAHLDRALAEGRAEELIAEDVRLAARALARLSGRVDAEDVLDKVFGSFCIGK